MVSYDLLVFQTYDENNVYCNLDQQQTAMSYSANDKYARRKQKIQNGGGIKRPTKLKKSLQSEPEHGLEVCILFLTILQTSSFENRSCLILFERSVSNIIHIDE